MADLGSMHPNDLARIKPPSQVEDKANWPTDSRRELLKRLLDLSLEESIPTDGLLKAFKQPLTVEAFTSLITMDGTPVGDLENDFEDVRYQKSNIFNLTWDATAGASDEDLKRAHRATYILTGDQPQINMLLRSQPFEIIAPIFRAFRCQGSKASVFHLCKVLDAMIKLNAEAVLTYLSGPRTKICLHGLFSNLHCSVVVDSAFNLLKLRPVVTENNVKTETMKLFHKKLYQFNPVMVLLSNIISPDVSVELRMGSADLLVRLLYYFDSVPVEAPNEGDLGESFLFKPLLSSPNLERLADIASQDIESYEPALWVFSTLCKIAAKGKLTTIAPISPLSDEVDDEKPKLSQPEQQKNGKRRLKDLVPPPAPAIEAARLAKLGAELKPLLKSSALSSSCNRALEIVDMKSTEKTSAHRHTSYEVVQPFTHRRLEWLRSLNYLLELDYQVPVPWKSLVAWQAQYPQNSMVQSEFSKALQTILTNSSSADECKSAICDFKLITQLVRRAKAHDTDHAHVLKSMNLLRLKADQLPKQHWLVQYLKSHSGWLEFLPTLKAETRTTLEPWLKDELPTQSNPVVPHGFSSSKNSMDEDLDGPAAALNSLFMSDPDNPLTALTRQVSSEMAKQEKELVLLDVELGSRFAKSLGFSNVTPVPQDIKFTKVGTDDSLVKSTGGQSATPPDKKKANKKKKNKA